MQCIFVFFVARLSLLLLQHVYVIVEYSFSSFIRVAKRKVHLKTVTSCCHKRFVPTNDVNSNDSKIAYQPNRLVGNKSANAIFPSFLQNTFGHAYHFLTSRFGQLERV